jgi:uncharacterized protein YecE (DUF72 family)
MDIHAGAVLDRPPGPKYTSSLHFAELAFPGALPKTSTLARFRAAVPKGFLCALAIPQSCLRGAAGPLRMDEQLEGHLGWISDAAEALDARALVVPTPPEVTPGQRDRDRLAAYFARLPRKDGRDVVWAPRGLWEREEIERLAGREGVLAAFDPLEDPIPAGATLYARLRTIGARSRISSGMLVDLVDRLGEAEATEAFVVISSPRSFKEAAALQAVAAGQEAPELPE